MLKLWLNCADFILVFYRSTKSSVQEEISSAYPSHNRTFVSHSFVPVPRKGGASPTKHSVNFSTISSTSAQNQSTNPELEHFFLYFFPFFPQSNASQSTHKPHKNIDRRSKNRHHNNFRRKGSTEDGKERKNHTGSIIVEFRTLPFELCDMKKFPSEVCSLNILKSNKEEFPRKSMYKRDLSRATCDGEMAPLHRIRGIMIVHLP